MIKLFILLRQRVRMPRGERPDIGELASRICTEIGENSTLYESFAKLLSEENGNDERGSRQIPEAIKVVETKQESNLSPVTSEEALRLLGGVDGRGMQKLYFDFLKKREWEGSDGVALGDLSREQIAILQLALRESAIAQGKIGATYPQIGRLTNFEAADAMGNLYSNLLSIPEVINFTGEQISKIVDLMEKREFERMGKRAR